MDWKLSIGGLNMKMAIFLATGRDYLFELLTFERSMINEEIDEKIVEKSTVLIIMIMEPITTSSVWIFVENCPRI